MKLRSVLFVCMGNICRSPLAEGIATSISNKNQWNLKIDSCGISGFHSGESPDSRSIKVAKIHGIDISRQKSRQINNNDKEFDLIIAMDSNNKRDILALGFPKEKVFKLGEFGNNEDIIDPYYDSIDSFFKAYELIESLLKKMFEKYED
ncbi:low molecular weight phosphotyrosine protein phosphatase [Helicobacter saguini]|uniref:protein-tyrosine-phosphatase n=1 Tax=Helicobacter saguini TaxID=1548018 RepID=A0A347VXG4_9HELI|nr:low molecular weight protein-tyrosine-phosphatase [Helicobacter saguini]MWV61646.1 low molecular weight phosphotyrosine protein phosphatase [Helicobacter saguini]MWV67682.1 low molecular weight phosphotyrosine protein phosphatase [Helicobacter saguini]MWV70034.1 low molecular weight phosphotyrosine protein phosphatase [Helicobacter saguini]MWV72753.1 low molecular weight phosphotyrosine protein phosphatase [Helicobacter saguini]TLD92736.1 low molecular weight phosphotyrosine protein phospha